MANDMTPEALAEWRAALKPGDEVWYAFRDVPRLMPHDGWLRYRPLVECSYPNAAMAYQSQLDRIDCELTALLSWARDNGVEVSE